MIVRKGSKKSQAAGKIKARRKLKDDESFSTVEKEEIPPSFDVKKDIDVRNREIKFMNRFLSHLQHIRLKQMM